MFTFHNPVLLNYQRGAVDVWGEIYAKKMSVDHTLFAV